MAKSQPLDLKASKLRNMFVRRESITKLQPSDRDPVHKML